MSDLLAHNNQAVFFFSALLLSLSLVPVAIRLAERLGAIDQPGGRKIHTRAVSRLGGLAMAAGLLVPLLLFQPADRLLVAFLLGFLVALLTGFFDDLVGIPPAVKFAGEIAASGVFVCWSGVSIADFGDLFGLGVLPHGGLAPWVTVFCMVGVMNAFNLSDGLDGLAGGLGVVGCSFLAVFAYLAKDWLSLRILVALLGALIGFLRYNSYPARLFMGDTGSLPLGYTLSAAAVLLVRNGNAAQLAPVTVAAVLALPILDTLQVMGSRIRRRENPFRPDKTHLHHRLLALGLPHAAVVPILYVSASAFGLLAWFLHGAAEWRQFGGVVALALLVYGLTALAERLGLRIVALKGLPWTREEDGLHSLVAPLLARSVTVVGWLIALGLCIPTVALEEVPRAVSAAALAVAAGVAALFPWRGGATRSAIRDGLLYAACACLLGIFQVIPGAPRWIPGYLAALSAAVFVWVLLKMRYRGQRELLPVSSFEILWIGLTIFAALVVAPALGAGEGVRRLVLTVCLEAVAFLLAIKIVVRHRPGRNYAIVAGFLAALAIVAFKGLLATGPATASPATPASSPPYRASKVSARPTFQAPPSRNIRM